MNNKVEVKCTHCGKKLLRFPSEIKQHKMSFCDQKCQGKYLSTIIGEDHPLRNRVEARCSFCGRIILVKPSRLKRVKNICCSYECRNNMYAGLEFKGDHVTHISEPINYYGPNWGEQRKKARLRDDNMCQMCGITNEETGYNMHVHHIKAFRTFNYIPGVNDNYLLANDLDNLVCLCANHHLSLCSHRK